jgi:NET1-associated nuclear protein 1 (U3 small nucleolar RNA-associated protein 17)
MRLFYSLANLLRRREGIPTDIAIDPRSQNLVLNGTVGQLQFYNPFTKRHVFDLEVVPHMHLPYGSKAHLTEPMVNHIAFTTNGSWMATVDSRYSKKSIIEPCLKFWFFDPEVQQ